MARMRLDVQVPVEEVFAARWSPRAYDGNAPVPHEALASMLEAARWSPSAWNRQPWRFVIADRFTDEDAWRRVLAALAPANRRWAGRAPVLVVLAALARDDMGDNAWAGHDAGQAALAFVLQATALGYATHQMAGFDPERIAEAVGLPEEARPRVVIAVGRPAPPEVLGDEELEARELAPRARRPLQEIAFVGRWGEGFVPTPALGWEARYRETPPERLPWFHPGLDADVARALAELGIEGGRALDLGCGPGTQAVALAGRGFAVTASDVSPAAVEAARARAAQAGVDVRFVVDDVLDSRLDGPFDLVLDRGVLHCFADEADRRACLETVARLLRPGGHLLLKCFHKEETRPEGPPARLDEDDIRRILGGDFELLAHWRTHFTSLAQEDPPKALFCILRRRG